MQIHPCSPQSPISADDAATKIQAGFRGYRVRKQLKENAHRNHVQKLSHDDRSATKENDENVQNNNLQNILANERNNGRDETMPMDIVKVPTAELKSAIRIQASVRGFLVRKKQKMALNAATKIQAGFRGFRTRKELRKLKA